MEKNQIHLPSPENEFSRTAIASHYIVYGFYGFFFKALLVLYLDILSFCLFYNILLFSIPIFFEASLLLYLYSKIKKDFFAVEKHKAKTEHPDTWVFRKMNEFHEKRKEFLSWGVGLSFLYIGCFVPISMFGGPMLTTLLFRNHEPYTYLGIWNKESMVYFTLSCIISTLWKYSVLASLTWTFDLF